MAKITSFSDNALIAIDNLLDTASSLFNPQLRFGVTGLARAGKTVFITALIHNLIHGGRLPLFSAMAQGRIARADLAPQPDDGVPRFQYENHLEALIEERTWPQSTSAISELRINIEYESASAWSRRFGAGRLTLDIVDYPGEWLLDLPLLGKSYAEWSQETMQLSRLPRPPGRGKELVEGRRQRGQKVIYPQMKQRRGSWPSPSQNICAPAGRTRLPCRLCPLVAS